MHVVKNSRWAPQPEAATTTALRPTIKRVIRSLTMQEAQEIAEKCLGCDRAAECQDVLVTRAKNLLPEYY